MDAMNVVSTNSELRHGRQYANQRITDTGVAVYFNGKPPANHRLRQMGLYRDNLQAVAEIIEALRGIKRWGQEEVDAAFRGFTAIPASATCQK